MLSLTRSGQKAKGRSLWLRPWCIRRSGAPSEPDQAVIVRLTAAACTTPDGQTTRMDRCIAVERSSKRCKRPKINGMIDTSRVFRMWFIVALVERFDFKKKHSKNDRAIVADRERGRRCRDGRLSDLNAQRSRHHNHHVTPIAFDLIRRSTHIIAQSHR